MKFLCIGIGVILIVSLGCAKKSKFSDSATVARVKVAQNGTIFLNGNVSSIDEVNKNFQQIKANQGRVRYFRESPQGDAPTEAKQVMQAIVDAKLPVKLCTSEEDLNGTQ